MISVLVSLILVALELLAPLHSLAQDRDPGVLQPSAGEGVRTEAAKLQVQPYAANPHYLARGNVPIFPLGASGFHGWTPISRPGAVDIKRHVARLADVIDGIDSPHVVGFMRVLPYDPMNHIHEPPVGDVLQPWMRLDDGRFDLERFSPEWEERLRWYLTETEGREIVVSLEIWDDWSVTRGPGGQYDAGPDAAWSAHPFNPKNNVNYDEQVLPESTAVCNAPFYGAIQASDGKVLRLQQQYVDKLLEIARPYAHVIVNLSNESRAHREWSRFWAAYVREQARQSVMIGDMPSTNRRDGGGECEVEFSPLSLSTDVGYEFVDVAQAVSGHEFADVRDQALAGGARMGDYRRRMVEANTRRPLVVSKDYTRGRDGGDVVLWSRFVGGAAAARFHRPGGDMSEAVVDYQHEAVGRLGSFVATVPFWNMHPSPDLVTSLPGDAGANVLAETSPRGHVVVQLLGGRDGETIDVARETGRFFARWIDPSSGEELGRVEAVAEGGRVRLGIPGELDHRVVHLAPAE